MVVYVCESGHGSCSQGGEDLQGHPERAEESRSRCKEQRERKSVGLDFYMTSLSEYKYAE